MARVRERKDPFTIFHERLFSEYDIELPIMALWAFIDFEDSELDDILNELAHQKSMGKEISLDDAYNAVLANREEL